MNEHTTRGGAAMKAISIWQPHASLLVGGIKLYETRSWPAPKTIIGQRVAIHAAKATDDLLDIAEYMSDLKELGGECDEAMKAFVTGIMALGFKTYRDLPRGAIIGTAILDASIPTELLDNPGHLGDFSPGRFAWRMVKPLALVEPIPFRGMQGFFNAPSSQLDLMAFHGNASQTAEADPLLRN